MSGDPLVLQLAERTVVDVLEVPGSRDLDLSGLSQLSGELLAGMTFSGCDAFESWLLVERRRLAAAGCPSPPVRRSPTTAGVLPTP